MNLTIPVPALAGKKVYLASFIWIGLILAEVFLGIDVPGFDVNPQTWFNDVGAAILAMFGRAAIGKIGTNGNGAPTPSA